MVGVVVFHLRPGLVGKPKEFLGAGVINNGIVGAAAVPVEPGFISETAGVVDGGVIELPRARRQDAAVAVEIDGNVAGTRRHAVGGDYAIQRYAVAHDAIAERPGIGHDACGNQVYIVGSVIERIMDERLRPCRRREQQKREGEGEEAMLLHGLLINRTCG